MLPAAKRFLAHREAGVAISPGILLVWRSDIFPLRAGRGEGQGEVLKISLRKKAALLLLASKTDEKGICGAGIYYSGLSNHIVLFNP